MFGESLDNREQRVGGQGRGFVGFRINDGRFGGHDRASFWSRRVCHLGASDAGVNAQKTTLPAVQGGSNTRPSAQRRSEVTLATRWLPRWRNASFVPVDASWAVDQGNHDEVAGG